MTAPTRAASTNRSRTTSATCSSTGPPRCSPPSPTARTARLIARRVPRPARRRASHRDPQPAARRPAALRPLPVPQDHRRLRLRVPTLRRPQTRRRPRHLAVHGRRPARPVPRPARLRQDPPRRRARHPAPSRPATAATSPPPTTWSPPSPSRLRRRHLRDRSSAPTPPRRVLVIDDVGLLPMDRAAASAFFQVINHRYENSPHDRHDQPGLPDWGELFGDAVVAAAILDRLMHNAVVFNIKGPSWRLREHHALADRDPERGLALGSDPRSRAEPAPRTSLTQKHRSSLIAYILDHRGCSPSDSSNVAAVCRSAWKVTGDDPAPLRTGRYTLARRSRGSTGRPSVLGNTNPRFSHRPPTPGAPLAGVRGDTEGLPPRMATAPPGVERLRSLEHRT